jgi:hypothetical protein
MCDIDEKQGMGESGSIAMGGSKWWSGRAVNPIGLGGLYSNPALKRE